MDLKLGDTELIIAECLKQGLLRNQTAYVLATAYHESAHTMKPISEMGGTAYLRSKRYYPYYGRGYVQLTWDYNYKKAGAYLGVDFIATPSLLLQAQYAVPILVIGMKQGWFTGKKLSDYMTLNSSDYINARRMINGTDQAQLIAGYAKTYEALLVTVDYGVTAAPVAVPQPISPPPAVVQPVVIETPVAPVPVAPVTPTAPAPKLNLIDIIILIFNAIFRR